MVEKTQQAEIRKVHKTREQLQAIRFREVVLSSTPEAQRAVAPFLQVPVLRRIVQTIANDPAGEFSKWATNPMILEHLSVAKKAMEDGLITEQEAEHLVLAQIKDPERNPQAAAAFEAVTKPKARLETAQLVGALNEQLQERNAGNVCYKAKRWDEAMSACFGCGIARAPGDRNSHGPKLYSARPRCAGHYEKALAILNFVQGASVADQEEVDANKATVLWNTAAVHLAQGEYGACVSKCTQALELQPGSIRVLLRRAKAYIQRGDYDAAEADLTRIKDLEPWSFDAEDVMAQLRVAKYKHGQKLRQFAEAAIRKPGDMAEAAARK